jgi:hypothetical protein
MNERFQNINQKNSSLPTPSSSFEFNSNSNSNNIPQPPQQQSQFRNEMRGPPPSDLDSILSGLKTRTIDIHDTSPAQPSQPLSTTVDEDSMISISSLKDIQNVSVPKKSNRRKNQSDKNIISLDI